MKNLLLEILTFGWYDPMKWRLKDAENEIDRLKTEAHRMTALHPKDDSDVD